MILRALQVGAIMGVFQVVAGMLLHLHRGRLKFGSCDEVSGVVITAALVGGSMTLAVILTSNSFVPRSTPMLAAGIALIAMLAGRFIVRTVRECRRTSNSRPRPIVIGADEAGEQLMRAMHSRAGRL